MAYRVTAYKDRAGKLHEEAERATIADIAMALGRVGTDPAVMDGIARKIFEAWTDVDQVMVEHRAIAEAKAPLKVVR